MRNVLLSTGLAFGLLSTSAVATVIETVTHESYQIYNPNAEYVVSGELGPSTFWFGLGFIDDRSTLYLNLIAPDDLPGTLEWIITSGPNVTGLSIMSGAIRAGETAQVRMAGSVVASPSNPIDGYFAMRALDVDASDPYVFGPTTSNASLLSSAGDPSNGSGGSPTNPTGQVATPTPLLLLLSILAGLALRSIVSPPPTTFDSAPRLVPAS